MRRFQTTECGCAMSVVLKGQRMRNAACVPLWKARENQQPFLDSGPTSPACNGSQKCTNSICTLFKIFLQVTVENPMKMEPVSRVNRIQKERWELNCCFCKQKMGAKIQCTACYTAYHPLCARIAGMHMEMKDGPQGSAGPLDLITYCPRHAPPHPELSGIKIVFDQHDGSHRVLFNRQPYPEPLAVSVPLPKAGSARAQVRP